MDFYFVSIYKPKGEDRKCFGLFKLLCSDDKYHLVWMFGHNYTLLKEFCAAVNREMTGELYLIESLVGEEYTYGYPFKPHYFAHCIHKSELYEYFSVG